MGLVTAQFTVCVTVNVCPYRASRDALVGMAARGTSRAGSKCLPASQAVQCHHVSPSQPQAVSCAVMNAVQWGLWGRP